MDTSKSAKTSRRGLFAGAATLGAAAAATSVLPKALAPATEALAPVAKPSRGGGYSLSEHVQRYYKTTRV